MLALKTKNPQPTALLKQALHICIKDLDENDEKGWVRLASTVIRHAAVLLHPKRNMAE